MPAIVQVKVVSARDLPIMDRSSELTDAFVEVKLGVTFHRTEVCPKTLNPVWDSQWFKFTVGDEDLQDEPLQIKLMDHDTYSAHDLIGKVYICLSSLADGGGAPSSSVLDGWFPIFDTLHGIRGEVHVKAKIKMIKDQHRFKQSSCGVQFFASTEVPCGYTVQAIHGFVEELDVNDDPEYQWIDKIRTPRASNEARQRLFSKLSGELQRRVGLKALEAGGNAVIGYRQCFDLEGESGIVVRGIGTCMTLIPSHFSPVSIPVQVPMAMGSAVNITERASDDLFGPSAVSVTSPLHPHGSWRRTSSSDSDGVPASPTKTTAGTSSSSGGFHHPTSVPVLQLSSSEFPFCTLTSIPSGTLRHIGGIVSARSVKLLDKINNPDEPETRDAWWQEVRNEVRSHTRAMGCNSVIGYSESTSICDTLCVFSAIGTAVCVGTVSTTHSRKAPTSPVSTDEGKGDGELSEGAGDVREPDMESGCQEFPQCGVCHVPYSIQKLPFEIRLSKCAVCHSKLVPSVLLSTGELPEGLAVRGRGCLVQARVCYHKRKIKGDENAFHVSKLLPFLEYKLHSRLLSKVHIKGMNAVFGLKVQVTVGDTILIGLATGTAVYLESIPPPSQITIEDKETSSSPRHLMELQTALNSAQDENRRKYDLELPVEGCGVGVAGELEGSGEEDSQSDLDFSTGKKEAFIVDVEDQVLKEEDLLEIIVDRPLPDGFHTSNMYTLPGLPLNMLSSDSKVVSMVTKKLFNEPRQHLEKQFTQFMDKIVQALAFKVRGLHPCLLTDVRFDVDLPDEDEVQNSQYTVWDSDVAVVAMVTRLKTNGCKHQPEELIFHLEDALSAGRSPPTTSGAPSSQEETTDTPVKISTLPLLPGCQVHHYLGIINLFLIRESTSIKESGGLNSFMHLFLLEALAVARAHVAALGGNALLSYRLNECVLIEHPHKNQAQCLLNLSGDAVMTRCDDSMPASSGSPQQAMEAMELISIPDSPRLVGPRPRSSDSKRKEPSFYHVTEL